MPTPAAPPPLVQVAASAPDESSEEGVVVDQDYGDREGYDPAFLDGLEVPLPALSASSKKFTVEVPAAHASGMILRAHLPSLQRLHERRLP